MPADTPDRPAQDRDTSGASNPPRSNEERRAAGIRAERSGWLSGPCWMCGVSHLNLAGHWQNAKTHCHAPGAAPPSRREPSARQPASTSRMPDQQPASDAIGLSTLKRKRPPHPLGTRIDFSTQLLSIVQFCNTFSQHLQIGSVSAEDFHAALGGSMHHTRANANTRDLLAHVHIVSDGTWEGGSVRTVCLYALRLNCVYATLSVVVVECSLP